MSTPNEVAQKIAAGDGWAFWRIGEGVYRAAQDAALDTWGLPMGRRWECDLDAWTRYRATVFGWATDTAS